MQRIHLPDPLRLAVCTGLQTAGPRTRGSAQIVDRLVAAERKLARRQNLYDRLEADAKACPVRWRRTPPRPSNQYAGAMSTQGARDPRLSSGAVRLLVELRARVGNGRVTHTTKTTLARALSASTRTIGRWLRDLVRFGYVKARPRLAPDGYYTGLVLEIAEKVLPCFRQLAWLSNWIAAQDAGTGRYGDRTIVSDKNHFEEESRHGPTVRTVWGP